MNSDAESWIKEHSRDHDEMNQFDLMDQLRAAIEWAYVDASRVCQEDQSMVAWQCAKAIEARLK